MKHLKTTKDPIDNLDLEPIIVKICSAVDCGGFDWPLNAARVVAEQYRMFLKSVRLKKQSRSTDDTRTRGVPPSINVDIFWHTHILFTQKYFDDCELIFGEYLHHDPILPKNYREKVNSKHLDNYSKQSKF